MTSETDNSLASAAEDHTSLASLATRGSIGGVLMGLANLVPGISGGTMLLAAGVYPHFISAIAEVTTLKFRPRSLVLLGTIVISAALAILLLAGLMRSLVIEQRWVMYSIFIGLTLGGLPLVWRLAKPATPAVFTGAAVAFLFMVAMQLGLGTGGSGGDASSLFLFLSGLAGASAMILPGVSGGYLLLILGQYETILGSIDTLKQGLLGGPDIDLILAAMTVVVPVGLGVVVGIVGVSNLLRWLLARYAKATLGALLGLLLGLLFDVFHNLVKELALCDAFAELPPDNHIELAGCGLRLDESHAGVVQVFYLNLALLLSLVGHTRHSLHCCLATQAL
ncbi:MAG: DUF368 domain-containing protein, partial [Planctomycetes bacterium]|nr:DUF368 domain-containing protein [Planctomycetota bacterium]